MPRGGKKWFFMFFKTSWNKDIWKVHRSFGFSNKQNHCNNQRIDCNQYCIVIDVILQLPTIFVIASWLICNCLLPKDSRFSTKCLGLVWLASNHMDGLGNSWDNPHDFWNFEIAHVLLRQFQSFQKSTQVIYPKLPSQTCDYFY